MVNYYSWSISGSINDVFITNHSKSMILWQMLGPAVDHHQLLSRIAGVLTSREVTAMRLPTNHNKSIDPIRQRIVNYRNLYVTLAGCAQKSRWHPAVKES